TPPALAANSLASPGSGRSSEAPAAPRGVPIQGHPLVITFRPSLAAPIRRDTPSAHLVGLHSVRTKPAARGHCAPGAPEPAPAGVPFVPLSAGFSLAAAAPAPPGPAPNLASSSRTSAACCSSVISLAHGAASSSCFIAIRHFVASSDQPSCSQRS